MFTERKLDGIERDLEHFFLRANAKYPDRGGAGKDRKWNDKKIVEDMRQEYSNFAKSHGVELDLRSNLAQGLDEAEPKIGPVHDRSEQSKNRGNLISKVESLRDGRLAKAAINPVEKKQKYELQQKAKERRKELWTSFHKQRRSNYSRLADEFKVSHVHQKEKLAQIGTISNVVLTLVGLVLLFFYLCSKTEIVLSEKELGYLLTALMIFMLSTDLDKLLDTALWYTIGFVATHCK